MDNSIISFAFQLTNGVPIRAFLGEKNDEELLFMTSFLEEIYSVADVRTKIEDTFKMEAFQKQVVWSAFIKLIPFGFI